MDQSCWILTRWRIVDDGFAASSSTFQATAARRRRRDGLTMVDIAQALGGDDDAAPNEPAILVGCSRVGSATGPYMHHLRPEGTGALICAVTGYNPGKEFTGRRIAAYKEQGVDYRWGYTFEDLSPHFRATPLAHFFADMFAERNPHADRAIDHLPVRGAGKTGRGRSPFEGCVPDRSSSPAAKTAQSARRACRRVFPIAR